MGLADVNWIAVAAVTLVAVLAAIGLVAVARIKNKRS